MYKTSKRQYRKRGQRGGSAASYGVALYGSTPSAVGNGSNLVNMTPVTCGGKRRTTNKRRSRKNRRKSRRV